MTNDARIWFTFYNNFFRFSISAVPQNPHRAVRIKNNSAFDKIGKKSTRKDPVAIMFFTCGARIKYHLFKKLQERGIAAAMKRAGVSLVASQVIIV